MTVFRVQSGISTQFDKWCDDGRGLFVVVVFCFPVLVATRLEAVAAVELSREVIGGSAFL